MANLLLILLALGLIPISAALLDNAKGPDARLGLAYVTVFLIWPWWAGATVLTAIAWMRGAFDGWHSSAVVRLVILVAALGLIIVSYLARATHLGLPSMLDVTTCIVMPAALLVLLAYVLHPNWASVFPSRILYTVAAIAIAAPVLVTSSKLGYELAKASPELLAEFRARREQARVEALRKEEEANTELRDLRAQLAALPVDCPFAALAELYVGNRPENFRGEVLAAMLRRPTIEADLARQLQSDAGGYSLAPYLIADRLAKPTAALAPALNAFLQRQAAMFPSYAGAYPEVFGREVNGFHTILRAAKRVQDSGGDLSPGLASWSMQLAALPNLPGRDSLLATVHQMQKTQR